MTEPQYRIKLFDNRWLDQLTVISAPVFISVWAAGLVLIAWAAAKANSPYPLLIVPGVLLWTLVEYAMHRYFFHWQPKSEKLQQLVFIMHGNHHAVPNDRLRNLMPLVVSMPVGALIWTGMVALAGPSGNWLFMGFAIGYVFYDLVHYTCHQQSMNSRLGRALKLHHMHHHYQRETGNYSITLIFWDRVFGTALKRSRGTK